MQKNSTCLDDESFRTLMCEIESVVNSRPLTVNSLNDPNTFSSYPKASTDYEDSSDFTST